MNLKMDSEVTDLETEIPSSPFVPSNELLKLQKDMEDMIDSLTFSLKTPQNYDPISNGDDSSHQQLRTEDNRAQLPRNINKQTPKQFPRNSSFFSDDGISREIQILEQSVQTLTDDLEKKNSTFTTSSSRQNHSHVLATLSIADSEFMGFIRPVTSAKDAKLFYLELKTSYNEAAHIPLAFILRDNTEGFDEDGEPDQSVGPIIINELKKLFGNKMIKSGFALCVVRNFKAKLLGVTCGRLSQLYRECAILSIHRYIHGDTCEIFRDLKHDRVNQFGLGAGDCELVHDILKDKDIFSNLESDPQSCVEALIGELEFDGFRGNTNKELPRLQNLQADVSLGLIPVYRYPGNYCGDEWLTFQWSPITLKIRDAVENALKPLVDQRMNHCVTNYYRDGHDFIGHHSDKDLDLYKDGVIVSVSIGDERVLELKRRTYPKDRIQIVLPHGSMLVLGPRTNREWTHSILPTETNSPPRISLTFRHVVSFIDLKTGRIFGDDIQIKTLQEVRQLNRRDDFYFFIGLGHVYTILFNKSKGTKPRMESNGLRAAFASVLLTSISYFTFKRFRRSMQRRKEESHARNFFSITSIHGTKY